MRVDCDEGGGADRGVHVVGHEPLAKAGYDDVVRDGRERREVGDRLQALLEGHGSRLPVIRRHGGQRRRWQRPSIRERKGLGIDEGGEENSADSDRREGKVEGGALRTDSDKVGFHTCHVGLKWPLSLPGRPWEGRPNSWTPFILYSLNCLPRRMLAAGVARTLCEISEGAVAPR